MNILVTGACGHIGSYFMHNLNKISNIKKVYAVDNLLSERVSSLFNVKSNKKIIFYLRDLKKKDSLNGIDKINIVIHLASMTNAAQSFKNKKKMYENNLKSFVNVINFCKKNKSNLIHISSTSVYGKNSGIVKENGPKADLNPQSPYAKIKLQEEELLKKNNSKIRYTTFRFGTIAGISKGMRFHTAVNSFCFSASLGQRIMIYKTAMNQYRPYLSIRDSFKVFKFCIENDFFKNEIYNALSGNFTVNQILKVIKKNKKKINLQMVNSPIMNQFSYHVDNNKLVNSGLLLNSNIETDIKNTLNLFKYLKNDL